MSETDEILNLPSADECDKRCKEFATITGTDTALAMFYLQDRDWSLDRALNSYFEENQNGASGGSSFFSSPTQTSSNSNNNSDQSKWTWQDFVYGNEQCPFDNLAKQFSSASIDDVAPYRIRLMCWNIDGLDIKNLQSRTLGVCDTILKEEPHVVFLQEVIPPSEEIIQEKCPMYHMIPGNDENYYVAMLLRTGHVQVEETKILPYPNTMMLRNLLTVKCTVKGEKFHLMTSHLESTRDKGCAERRKEQLRQCFSYIQKKEADRTVVFGGDLNLRDAELAAIGGIPTGVSDIWEVTGKRPEAEFTWDMRRNDNLEWSHRNKPKCRFDRVYFRPAEPLVVKPEYFELIGLERLKSCQRFCSDHWGLLTHFNILSKVPVKKRKFEDSD